MKATRILAPAALALLALLAAPASQRPALAQTGAGDFGSPPSGEVPILFNDRHVYATPDKEKKSRVLAALVRGGTILVPLRSMFEAMGATVNYYAATKSVEVSKVGADVKLTLDKPEVTINGEIRPLDVPPTMYQGTIVVPVRVISEGMGAYVLWVPEKRLVVVRYIVAPPAPAPATPPPTPPPTPLASAPPLPPPPSLPPAKVTPSPYEKFIVGDYLISPKVYNEFSPGNTGSDGYRAAGALEFPFFGFPWEVGADYRTYSYPHNAGAPGPCPDSGNQGCVNVIGGQGKQTYVPAFSARESSLEGQFGLKIADPRIYLDFGYEQRTNNYGYPAESGIGIGLNKLPDLERSLSFYGSFFYYPSIAGTFQNGTAAADKLEYSTINWSVGAALSFPKFPVYLDFGFAGENGSAKKSAPEGYSYGSPYAGLGVHF